MKTRYFQVTMEEAKEPAGIASASARGCMCCGKVLSGMGGPGHWLCFDCLSSMELGDVASDLWQLERLRGQEKFNRRRLDLLQQAQRFMRDPERTMVCDILANVALLPDQSGERYAIKEGTDAQGEAQTRNAQVVPV
jgi:hypothetical protein